MANRRLLQTGAGMVGRPSRIVLDRKGNFQTQAINSINAFMDSLTGKINGLLSFGDGAQSSLSGNIYGQYVEFTTPTAGTQFAVDHGLSGTPFARLVVRQDAAGQLYDVNLGGWGDETVYFKCDATGILMKILLLANPGG
jgi:hypothetical protein